MDSLFFDVVAEVETGEELVYAMREHQPDLLFLDINMPKVTGLDFLKQYGSEFSQTCIIILTSAISAEIIEEISSMGAYSLLRKDTSPEKMVEHIKKCWKKHIESKNV